MTWEILINVVSALLGVGVGHFLSQRMHEAEAKRQRDAQLDHIAYNVFAEMSENLQVAKRNKSVAPRLGATYATDGWDQWKGQLFQELLTDESDAYEAARRAYVAMKRANYYLAAAPSYDPNQRIEHLNTARGLAEEIEDMIMFALVKIDQVEPLSIHKRMGRAKRREQT